ncbi:hypothetical protein [Methanolobus sp. WCC5]|uniref:hypothetical protein n=1 Tax=Methanolobus sp. WCC5 TaxID=3125785 RepID=UPI003255EA50
MPQVEFKGKRTTKPVGFSLSPYLVEKLDEYAGTDKYGNKSSIASQALYEFFAREEMRNENREIETNVQEGIQEYLHSPEGRALIKSVIMEAFTHSDEEHARESKKKGKPVIVDEIIE